MIIEFVPKNIKDVQCLICPNCDHTFLNHDIHLDTEYFNIPNEQSKKPVHKFIGICRDCNCKDLF